MNITGHNRRGFTLIELLVVIAIIGILSAVVLASLNTARSKGNDAAIKQDLHSVQTQAEIYYGNNSSSYGTAAYATACAAGMFSDATIGKAKAGADTANGSGNVYCYAATNAYLMAADLATAGAGYWCIDSSGTARAEAGAAPSSAPAGNVCP